MPIWNVKQFGAAGDGAADDTAAFRSACEAAAGGGTVYIPTGNYRITGPVAVRHDHTSLTGDGMNSRVVYEYEQRPDDGDSEASLFVFREGISGIAVRELKCEYKGSFFGQPGQSYAGKVSALRFSQCFDVVAERLEICGFNDSAVKIATGDERKYAARFKVTRCHLHHNRVAGVLFGYVDGISIMDNDLNDNGSPLDGGTGYGCAGSSLELPLNVQVVANRANGNYRKGIDLHAGVGAVIADNICHGNRLYGIYAEGRKTGNATIRGNIVSGMNRDALDIGEPYTWIMGIDFGPYADEPATEGHYNFIVEGNQILNFGLGEGDAYPFNCYYNMARGNILIRNNIVTGGQITRLVRMNAIAEEDAEARVQLDISGNLVSVVSCSKEMFDLPRIDRLNMTGNQISVEEERPAGVPIIRSEPLGRLLAEGRARVSGNFMNGRLAAFEKG
ncbi:right-handed parallel beta-helix repeat-containing protein [Cohnella soli]|uniref:Right-handed parallel beta-helix repeat-containing protein n=1 Tax=Cohnella soli TaxID=425005 RepID=A0ABW0HNE1_9BACL